MSQDLALMVRKTHQFVDDLKKYYPHKKSDEYTRLMDALEDFQDYGFPEDKPVPAEAETDEDLA